jgi:aspartate/methionine/tyrosine aminotransferase
MADCGVLLTPGMYTLCPVPGYFRICYAFVNPVQLQEALDRITVCVRKRLDQWPQEDVRG